MNLRARGPTSQATITGLDPEMTVEAFLHLLQQQLALPHKHMSIRAGFPPKAITMPSDPTGATLASLQIGSGESITVCLEEPVASAAPTTNLHHPASETLIPEEDEDLARAIAASLADATPPSAAPPTATAQPTASQAGNGVVLDVPLPDGMVLTRRVIDSDNSCLFNAVGYVMEHGRTHSARLRQVIVDAVQGDPLTYNAGFLGREPEEYCKWITLPSSWGGGIELSILSRHYAREIAAFDIHTQRADVYGEDAGYDERVLLLYDGLHYDALALAQFQGAPEDLDVTIVQNNTPLMADTMGAARTLVQRAHDAKQYTDTGSFTLRCGVCYIGVKGEKEAVEHAKATGHQNFSEYH